ncbi:MAG: hypothetical protein ACI9KE_005054 [Polyangiales bacterium]|jgi:hypothetical protein
MIEAKDATVFKRLGDEAVDELAAFGSMISCIQCAWQTGPHMADRTARAHSARAATTVTASLGVATAARLHY